MTKKAQVQVAVQRVETAQRTYDMKPTAGNQQMLQAELQALSILITQGKFEFAAAMASA